MTIPLSQLPNWLQDTKATFIRNVNVGMREAARAGAFTLVEGTPADTGRARSNWNAWLGQPQTVTEREPFAPGSHLGRGETANLQSVMATLERVIAVWQPADGDLLSLSNSVSYIEDLDRGKSTQGGNFSDAAVASALNLISTKRFI